MSCWGNQRCWLKTGVQQAAIWGLLITRLGLFEFVWFIFGWKADTKRVKQAASTEDQPVNAVNAKKLGKTFTSFLVISNSNPLYWMFFHYHSTENSAFERETNGTKISLESFRKIRIFFSISEFEMRTIRTKSWEINQMNRKFLVRNLRTFGYNSRGCPLYRKLLLHPAQKISGVMKCFIQWNTPIIKFMLHLIIE